MESWHFKYFLALVSLFIARIIFVILLFIPIFGWILAWLLFQDLDNLKQDLHEIKYRR